MSIKEPLDSSGRNAFSIMPFLKLSYREEYWQKEKDACRILPSRGRVSSTMAISGVKAGRMASKNTTPLRRAASSIRWYSSWLEAAGFSQSTCLPASIIRMACSQWQQLGLAMYTACTSRSAARSSRESVKTFAPYSSPKDWAFSRLREYTARSVSSGTDCTASKNVRVIFPVPIIPKGIIPISPFCFLNYCRE